MFRSHQIFRAGMFASAALASAVLAAAPAQAWTFKVLHSFCAKQNCADGGVPQSLLLDSSGNLFGIIFAGGRRPYRLFELSPAIEDQWHYQVLSTLRQGSVEPAPLIIDTSGNLYSTTWNGGKNGRGSVFELVRPKPGGRWQWRTLYSFCNVDSPYCFDGSDTQAGLTYAGQASGAPYDGVSPLYGSTSAGGGEPIFPGVVFRLRRNHAAHWRYRVIYTFCAQSNCSDGSHPGRDGVVANDSGDLFGTTRAGGANNGGTLFALRTGSKERRWREYTLHTFCSQPNCSDGSFGVGGLLLDRGDGLIGVTEHGGNSCALDTAGCGVLFQAGRRISPSGFNVLHAFCSDTDCADGAFPEPGVIENRTGTIFGTTYGGGNVIDQYGNGGGVVYSFNRSSQSFQVLHAFCAEPACADGKYPWIRLARDAKGNLFGATEYGGEHGGGVIYELSP